MTRTWYAAVAILQLIAGKLLFEILDNINMRVFIFIFIYLFFFQSKMGDCQLDDLLDMMNDDEDEATFAEAEAAALSAASQEVSTAPKSQKNSSVSSSGSLSEVDPEKEALKKQLEEMEKQMKMIKSQLGGAGPVSDEKSVTEIDMFSRTTNISGDHKNLRSPVKVNIDIMMILIISAPSLI